MRTPSEWPVLTKRAVLVTASLLVILAYALMCLALTRFSVLLLQ